MKVVVVVDDADTYQARDDIKFLSGAKRKLPTRKVAKTLAQDIIDRYYSPEYFDYDKVDVNG